MKKILFAAAVAATLFFGAANAAAADTYNEVITPNKLTITWLNSSRSSVVIDTFRIRGYNVAQLRTLVGACGGTVSNRMADGSYQINKSNASIVQFTPIAFSGTTTVKTQFNITPIRDSSGRLMTPEQPGWVYLPDYQYNWGSLRDILRALDLEIASYTDEPANARTSVIIAPVGSTPSSTPTPTPTPTKTGTPTPTPVRINYDLASKPFNQVSRDLYSLLDNYGTSADSQGRPIVYGVTRADSTFTFYYLTWDVAVGRPLVRINSGTAVPEDRYIQFTYIGPTPTPTPPAPSSTPTPTATPTPPAATPTPTPPAETPTSTPTPTPPAETPTLAPTPSAEPTPEPTPSPAPEATPSTAPPDEGE
ncbi:MAG: hypothetical protein LBU32_05180 [Clostridiales bacterium]|nr:hypothetical protein [Clostridiales bacterium]